MRLSDLSQLEQQFRRVLHFPSILLPEQSGKAQYMIVPDVGIMYDIV